MVEPAVTSLTTSLTNVSFNSTYLPSKDGMLWPAWWPFHRIGTLGVLHQVSSAHSGLCLKWWRYTWEILQHLSQLLDLRVRKTFHSCNVSDLNSDTNVTMEPKMVIPQRIANIQILYTQDWFFRARYCQTVCVWAPVAHGWCWRLLQLNCESKKKNFRDQTWNFVLCR